LHTITLHASPSVGSWMDLLLIILDQRPARIGRVKQDV
jgi:hypothetical protein